MRWFVLMALPLTLTALFAAPSFAADPGVPEQAKAIERDLVSLVERVSKAFVMIGGGSGVVISPDGWMLTNDHVVAQIKTRKTWPVMLPIRKRYMADLVGNDETGDLALLKIKDAKNLPHVPLGDSDALKPGHLVVALGNPYSHAFRTAEPTVTFGIVSAVHRNQITYSDAIQTDAPLNPGNSGGPLINLDGELVGINGRVRVRFAEPLRPRMQEFKYNTGVGLAIPTSQIKRFLPLLKKGDIDHGHLPGLILGSIRIGPDAMIVRNVRPGTLASRAGLKAGDRILSVDGLPAWNPYRFWGILHAYPEGAKVVIEVERQGEKLRIPVTLLRWRPGRAASVEAQRMKPGLGVEFWPEAPATGGAEIKKVLPSSAASQVGLKRGDIIIRIDDKQVLGPEHLEELIQSVYRQVKSGSRKTPLVRLKVQRGLEEKEFAATLGPEPE